jgi:hypothetical protein
MVEDLPEVIHEGYASEDSNHWVCEECFEDFKDLFQWEVIIDENDPISDASQPSLCLKVVVQVQGDCDE